MKKTRLNADETLHQSDNSVTLPTNLVRQTIAYLESRHDPMAAILKEHYKSWLEMSINQLQQEKLAKTSVLYK